MGLLPGRHVAPEEKADCLLGASCIYAKLDASPVDRAMPQVEALIDGDDAIGGFDKG
jgi:hypothetical protein